MPAAPRTDPYPRNCLIRLLPWVMTWRTHTYPVQPTRRTTPAQSPVRGRLDTVPLGHRPSLRCPIVEKPPGGDGYVVGGRRRVIVPALSVAPGAPCRQWAPQFRRARRPRDIVAASGSLAELLRQASRLSLRRTPICRASFGFAQDSSVSHPSRSRSFGDGWSPSGSLGTGKTIRYPASLCQRGSEVTAAQ